LSISGGVAVVNAKFPIAKAAEMAGEAEDAAKKYSKQKNAFNMFGETVSWMNEFDYVKTNKDKLVELIKNYGLSRSILHKIKKYALIVKENMAVEVANKKGEKKRKPDWSYVWHKAYYLTRYMGKEKDNKEVYKFCMSLRDEKLLTPNDYRMMSLAARWAELELRETDNTNTKNE